MLKILERNLNSDPKLIEANNTYHFLDQNHETVSRLGTKILLICGEKDSWKDTAVNFQKALQAKNIDCSLALVPGVGHNLPGLCKAEGANAAKFQDGVYRSRKAK